MPGVPSNKACERCKKKHMKCDETRPACQRCQTANVDCPGYKQTRKFIDQGASVRRRFAPYQEPPTRSEPTKSPVKGPEIATPQGESFPAMGELQDSQKNEHQAQRACERETQALEDSGSEPLMAERPSQVGPPEANSHRPIASTPASGSIFSPTYKYDVSAVDESEQPSRATGYHEMLPDTAQTASGSSHYSEFDQAGPGWDLPEQQSEGEELQSLFTDLRTDTEHETAFLLRYYAETVGTWLDISDSGKFFSVLVPIRALSSMSLKYAVAAITAKQLGLVGGVRPTFMTESTTLATTELYPNSSQVDWFLKATNYYYLANSSFSDHYTVMPSSIVFDSPISTFNAWLKTQMLEESGQQSYDERKLREIEDKLAAVTLMVFYKLLDSGIKEWHSHLSGINVLFESLMMLCRPSSTLVSHGIRASFWNFVRQDFCGGYILRVPTHISPTNLSLWRAGGILIDDSKGFYVDSNGDIGLSREDQCLNGLSWLLSRMVHFLSHLEKSQLEQWTESHLSMPPRDLQETSGTVRQNLSGHEPWLELCFAFQSWFEGLPESFHPCVRIEKPRALDGTRLPFPETFFSSSTCAAAMQHYHFGRVALLLNRPEDDLASPNHNAFNRLKGYREVTKEVEHRCREVCGIALGRPSGAARAHMIPLLFGIGKCLERSEERQVVLEILRGVRNDLGLQTHSIASVLVESWND